MRFESRPGINPIIVKELRSRMRGARAFAILTGVLLLLGVVSYALYRIVLATSTYSSSPLSPQIGQILFVALAFLELMMVCFIAPAVTAGAISGERERQTYEMLLTTPLRPTSILWGKLVSALSYVFLLIFAAVPLASLVFIFGGVSLREMFKALIILLAVTVMLGVVGVFMSAWLGRTARATVASYLVVLALLIGPVFIYILVGVLRQAEPPRWLLIPNPVSALFSALSPSMPSDGLSGFFWSLGMGLGGNLALLSGTSATGVPRPLYHYTLPLYGALTLGLYFGATRLVRPTQRWRLGWRAVLITIAVLALFGGLVAGVFLLTADRYEWVGGLATPTPMPVVVEREVFGPVLPSLPVPVPTEAPVFISPLAGEFDPLDGSRWQLAAIESEAAPAIPARPLLFVAFNAGELGLQGGCSRVAGRYQVEGERLTVTLVEVAGVDCSDEMPGIREVEAAFADAMPTFESYLLADEELRIRYAAGELVLRRALKAPSASP